MSHSKIDVTVRAARDYNEGLIKEILDTNGISTIKYGNYYNFAREIEGKKVQTNEDVEKVIRKWKEKELEEEIMRRIMRLIPKHLRP